MSHLVNDPNFELQPEHITSWEREHGKIPRKCIVLVSFGWSGKYYDDRDTYYGFNRTQEHELNFTGKQLVYK